MKDQTREFFEFGDILTPKGLTPRHRISKLAPWNGPGPLWVLPPDGFSYPVQPAYELTMEAGQDDTQIIRYLAPSGGLWYIVVPCPNEKGMAFVRENIARGNAQKQRVSRLVTELKDPLLGDLKDLLKQHRKLDAVKKYQQATGQDLTLAVMVMNAIDPEHPR